MALTITKAVNEAFDPNVTDSSGGFALISSILNNDPEAARAGGLRPLTFSAEGLSVGNEAVSIANLAPFNLTLLGVTFPASTIRVIRTRCWSRRVTIAQAGYAELLWAVVGGATPSIVTSFATVAGVAAINNPAMVAGIPNNNSSTVPEYGQGVVVLDPVATTNVIVGPQNILGSTGLAVTATTFRWRIEVFVDPLVTIPVAV